MLKLVQDENYSEISCFVLHLLFTLSFTMTTFLATDLEIQEAMDISEGVVDELDEEEKKPIDESVSTIILDLDLNSSDWFDTPEEDVTEEQDPFEEEQDPLQGLSFNEKRERLSALFTQRLKDGG
jgi:hypothetical protein